MSSVWAGWYGTPSGKLGDKFTRQTNLIVKKSGELRLCTSKLQFKKKVKDFYLKRLA